MMATSSLSTKIGGARRAFLPGLSIAVSLLQLLSSPAGGQTTGSVPREFCQSETFKATCWRNEVIVMETALYGRMRLGRCVEADLGYIGCSANVLHLADRWCSGRRTCEIGVPNEDLDNTKPCFKELKTHLEAGYKCVKVASAQKGLCDSSNYVKLVSTDGYLASIVAQETGCGSQDTPWIIQVDPGQKINLTLFDFNQRETDRAGITHCDKYAIVRERARNKSSVICGGSARETHAYLSETNSIEVVLSRLSNNGQFMLYYETVGCSDLDPPLNAWFRRTMTGGVIGCKSSDSTWHLTCENNQWVGVVGNCTGYIPPNINKKPQTETRELPYGLSLAIIIGIALAIGLLILSIGLMCFAKKKLPRRRHVKQREPMGGSVTYKVYEKAPCIGLEPTGPLQAYIQHRTPVSINGNEYSHIWESPLPGEPAALNLHESSVHENPYGTQCDCGSTYAKGRRDLFLTQLNEECTQPAECAHVPSGQHCQVAECFEGHRYFVLDRDAAAACRDSNHSPDVVPPDGAC